MCKESEFREKSIKIINNIIISCFQACANEEELTISEKNMNEQH